MVMVAHVHRQHKVHHNNHTWNTKDKGDNEGVPPLASHVPVVKMMLVSIILQGSLEAHILQMYKNRIFLNPSPPIELTEHYYLYSHKLSQ